MRRPPRPAALALALVVAATALLAACFAAPTPHPAKGDDGITTGSYADALPDASSVGMRYADACAATGGAWDDASGLCELDFGDGVDPDYMDGVDASTAPAGDAGGALSGDADTNGGQGADGGTPTPSEAPVATVSGVQSSGEPGGYSFAVTVESPDTGCDLYADWWEVVRPDGALVYRRLMSHSHVDEQPFTRDGGPVEAAATDVLVVRAHLHGAGVGYGTAAMVGTVQGGFAPTRLPTGFGWKLSASEPLPADCAF